MLPISDAFRHSLRVNKDPVALARIYYGPEASYLTIGSKKVSLDGDEYLHLIQNDPYVDQDIDMFTHSVSISELSLDIVNFPYKINKRFSDVVEDSSLGVGNDFGLYNRRCEVRIYSKGVTTWNDCFLLFDGKIRDIQPSDSNEIITLTIQDRTELEHKDIGTFVSSSDTSGNFAAPQVSLGKIKPIIYGDHISNYGLTSSAAITTPDIDNNLVPSIYLNIQPDLRDRYLVAEHKVASVDKLWANDPTFNSPVEVETFVIEQNNSNGCIVSLPASSSYYAYIYSDGTNSNDQTTGSDWTLLTKANDKNTGNFAQSVQATGDEFPNEATRDLDYSGYIKPGDVSISNIDVFTKAYWTKESGIIIGDVTFAVNQRRLQNLIAQNTVGIADADPESADEAGANANVEIRHFKTNSNSNMETIARVYETWKRMRYSKVGRLEILFGGKSKEYNSWIAGRTQTETHIDSGNSGSLIENPIGIIEDILRNQLSIEETAIATGSFNVASNDISAWSGSFGITEPINSLDLITSLAENSRSYIWWQPNGTYKIKVLEDTYTASDRVIDFNKIIENTPGRSTLDQLFTKVNVLYKISNNLYQKKTGFNQDTTMQTKYNVTGTQTELQFKSDYIATTTTADNLRDYKLAQWKQLHNTFEVVLPNDYIDLDLGDIIEYSNVPYNVFGEDITSNTTRAGQTIYKYWWLYGIRRGLENSTIKCFQLHDLS